MCTMGSPKHWILPLPIPFDHSLYLIEIVQLQLSSVLLAKICPRGVTLRDRAVQLQPS